MTAGLLRRLRFVLLLAPVVALFACGRAAGWAAHVIEQHAEDHLIRPMSEYVGPRGLTVDR